MMKEESGTQFSLIGSEQMSREQLCDRISCIRWVPHKLCVR